jgi:colanic acid/amylovoran biosynthesis glycosyltransferase
MEAMACELTVISTRHAGIPELIEDGENGLLVNERDPAALAAAIEAAADPVLRARLGPAARATVRARHDAATLNGQLQELLLELSR